MKTKLKLVVQSIVRTQGRDIVTLQDIDLDHKTGLGLASPEGATINLVAPLTVEITEPSMLGLAFPGLTYTVEFTAELPPEAPTAPAIGTQQ
jgi:hypothetical protein